VCRARARALPGGYCAASNGHGGDPSRTWLGQTLARDPLRWGDSIPPRPTVRSRQSAAGSEPVPRRGRGVSRPHPRFPPSESWRLRFRCSAESTLEPAVLGKDPAAHGLDPSAAKSKRKGRRKQARHSFAWGIRVSEHRGRFEVRAQQVPGPAADPLEPYPRICARHGVQRTASQAGQGRTPRFPADPGGRRDEGGMSQLRWSRQTWPDEKNPFPGAWTSTPARK
jgi:hypothetical protein